MKNSIFLIITCLFASISFAQVKTGVGTKTPVTNLQVVGAPGTATSADGITIPRLTGDELAAKDAVYVNTPATNNTTGTVVYVTAAVTTPAGKTVNVTAAGFYYFDGTAWQQLTNTNSQSNIYDDNGTIGAGRTLGITDNVNFDSNTFVIDGTNNRIGVGEAVPTASLDVNGTVRVRSLGTGVAADEYVTVDTNGNLRSLASTAANTPNIYTEDGSLTGNRVVTQGTNTLAFTSTATNGFSIDGNTFSVDAANNRIGIGEVAPTASLDVNGTARVRSLGTGVAADEYVTVDTSGNLRSLASTAANTPNIYTEDGSLTGNRVVTQGTNTLAFSGRVAVGGTTFFGTTAQLSVNGSIETTTSVYPDYVFEKYLDGHSIIKEDYKFSKLDEVANFIKTNKHLPGVTSIKELRKTDDGKYAVNITNVSMQMLEKIEELYLHTIEQNNIIKEQQQQLEKYKQSIQEQSEELTILKKRLLQIEEIIEKQ